MRCRACGAVPALTMLDLGSAPPSNAYLTASSLREATLVFPLRVVVCETCWLAQTEDYAGREALFTESYAYFSSFSTSWLAHARSYWDQVRQRLGLDKNKLVVEVAANDGYLLQFVRESDVPCYGIEPTASTAHAARGRGIEIVEEFFGRDLAATLAARGRQADLMVANNVLAHVPDIRDFGAGFTLLLKPAGVATFEFPHLLRMVRENQFDTAYHEHYSYLSLGTVTSIFDGCGLAVFDVEELPTHGGSLRVFAQRVDSGVQPVSPRVNAILTAEDEAGMRGSLFYAGFQSRAEKAKDDLLLFLLQARRQGRRVAAYGAAAKGNTLLNFAGVRPDLLPYVVDRNPAKQGLFMPGSRIPIVPEERLTETRPELILILPWNLRTEVREQLAYARDWGARFVTAIPEMWIEGT